MEIMGLADDVLNTKTDEANDLNRIQKLVDGNIDWLVDKAIDGEVDDNLIEGTIDSVLTEIEDTIRIMIKKGLKAQKIKVINQ